MSDGFWTMLGVVLPVLIVQIFQYISARRTAAKSEADRLEIKQNVAQVRDRIETVTLSKEDMELLMKGRERELVTKGIEEGRRQATAPAPLDK